MAAISSTQENLETAQLRRLAVLKSIQALHYEAPQPKRITTTAKMLASEKSGISLHQLTNLLKKLEDEGLAKFEYGWGSQILELWSNLIVINSLDFDRLEKSIEEIEKPFIKKDRFHNKHPIIIQVFVTVLGGLILAAILACLPSVHDFIIALSR